MSEEALDWDLAYREYRYKVVTRSLIAVMVLLVALIGFIVTTEDAKPWTVAGMPVKAWQPAPYVPPTSQSPGGYFQVLVDSYRVEYEKLLSDGVETTRVTDGLIANRDPSHFTVPVYSTDLIGEIVANATLEESQQALRSLHSYPMCTLQDGASVEFVGNRARGDVALILLQYIVPPVVKTDGQHCTGDEYFFMSPEMFRSMFP